MDVVSGGFNPGPKVRRLSFDDDTPFPGLWIRVGGMSFDEWLGLKVGAAVDLFADRLVEWNWVGDDGKPVPPTREGVGSLDASDVRTLVSTWSDHVAEVHRGPFEQATTPDTEFEAQIPMAPASPDVGT